MCWSRALRIALVHGIYRSQSVSWSVEPQSPFFKKKQKATALEENLGYLKRSAKERRLKLELANCAACVPGLL